MARLEHSVEMEVSAIQGRATPPFTVVSGEGVSAAVVWRVRPASLRARRAALAAQERQRRHDWELAGTWTDQCVAEAEEEPSAHLWALAAAWDLEVLR